MTIVRRAAGVLLLFLFGTSARAQCPFRPSTEKHMDVSNPQGLLVAYVNRAFLREMIVLDTGSNRVMVQQVNDDSTFADPVMYDVGSAPVAATLGSLNQGDDNVPDLAVANSESDTVSVLYGNGDGTFQTAIELQVGAHPVALAALDGVILVVNHDSNSVTVLLSDGARNWSRYDVGVGSGPTSLVPVSLHYGLAGKYAVMVTNRDSDDISVLMPSDSGWHLDHSIPVRAAPRQIEYGGSPCSSEPSPVNQYYLVTHSDASGNGGVSLHFFQVGESVSRVREEFHYEFAPGSDPVDSETFASSGQCQISGFGIRDFAVVKKGTNSVAFFRGLTTTPTEFPVGNQPVSMSGEFVLNSGSDSVSTLKDLCQPDVPGDFNADSKAELTWRQSSTGDNAIWSISSGAVTASLLPSVPDTSWKVAGVGDFNADRKSDLVWTNDVSGAVQIWFMDGASVTPGPPLPVVSDTNWKIEAVVRGGTDIVWRHQLTGRVVIWRMDVSGQIATTLELPTVADVNWSIVGTGDFNGDGYKDIFWRHAVTGDNAIWFMDSNSFHSASLTLPVADLNYRVAGIGTFSPDSKADIVWVNTSTGDVVLWLMDAENPSGYLIGSVSDSNWRTEAAFKYGLVWRNVATGETVLWNFWWSPSGPYLLSAQYLPQTSSTSWEIVAPR